MKIDWKHLATTTGYKSLKAAYIYDLKNKRRSKKELYTLFHWVIGRAKHIANATNVSVESVLNAWEEQRTYWWLNYYQNSRQPKLHSNSIKPMGINGRRKYYKEFTSYPSDVKYRVNEFIQINQRDASTKVKKRWTRIKKKSRQ